MSGILFLINILNRWK